MTVLQEIEDLRQKLRYYSDKYYNDDAPEIEDYQYDMMMRRLESLEQANPRYVSPDSPTQKWAAKRIIPLLRWPIRCVWRACRMRLVPQSCETLTGGCREVWTTRAMWWSQRSTVCP